MHYHSRKCIWKCLLQNSVHFVSASKSTWQETSTESKQSSHNFGIFQLQRHRWQLSTKLWQLEDNRWLENKRLISRLRKYTLWSWINWNVQCKPILSLIGMKKDTSHKSTKIHKNKTEHIKNVYIWEILYHLILHTICLIQYHSLILIFHVNSHEISMHYFSHHSIRLGLANKFLS